MSRKIWFAYMGTSYAHKVQPGIYYDDLPNHKENKLHKPFVAGPFDISHLATGPDGEITASFAELMAVYPPPVYVQPAKVPLDLVTTAINEDMLMHPVDSIVNAAMAESMQD